MVLAVLDLGKIAKESLSGPEGPGTVKTGMPSKKKNSYKTSAPPSINSASSSSLSAIR